MTEAVLSNPKPEMTENTTYIEKRSEIALRANTSEEKLTPIKRIPETFRKNGLNYVMRERNQNAVLYELLTGTSPSGFEVCTIKLLPAEVIRGNYYPVREALPSDEEFGMDGSKAFFPDDYKMALDYFRSLERLQISRHVAFTNLGVSQVEAA